MFSSAIINGSLIGFLILAGISLCNGQEEKQEQISDRLHRVKRIVNGVIPQDKEKYGYVVSIQHVEDRKLAHFCGGSHIGNGWILTAAHCLYMKNWKNFYVRLGANDLSTANFANSYRILEVHFNNYVTLFMTNDIALMRIDLQGKDYPKIQMATNRSKRTNCEIGGFGSTNFSLPASNTFLVAPIETVHVKNCLFRLGFLVFPSLLGSIICAGGGRTDTCQGDSGSGLICNGVLTGLTSYGRDCGVQGVPAVYTDVQRYSGWIATTMAHKPDQKL